MTDRGEPAANTGGTAAQGEPQTAMLQRRSLLKAGLGGPVILSLANRPAFGQACLMPSNFASGNVSAPGNGQACLGRSPGYWKTSQHFCEWLAPYQPLKTGSTGYTCGAVGGKATLFHSTTTMFNGTQYVGKTMLDVLNLMGGGVDALARHITAALLNAKAGLTPVLKAETNVRDIWNEFVAKGFFEPSAGVHWGPDQIVTYLQTTMTVTV